MVIISSIGAYVAAQLIRLSPFIYRKMKPILFAASEDVWSHAAPLAVGFIRDLADNGKIDGWQKHAVCCRQLEAALLADGKFVVKGVLQVSGVVIGQIVLSEFVNAGL